MLPNQDSYTVVEIVEGAGFRRPLLTILALCFLLMVCDSYDVAALSFTAPVLIKVWGIAPSAMGFVFSVGLFGLLVGSILFGWVGDRFGRKRAMILGALGFSVLTAVTGLAGSQTELLVLRFLATIGLVPLHSGFDRLAPETVRSGKGCFQAERCSGRGFGKDNSRRSGLGSDQ